MWEPHLLDIVYVTRLCLNIRNINMNTMEALAWACKYDCVCVCVYVLMISSRYQQSWGQFQRGNNDLRFHKTIKQLYWFQVDWTPTLMSYQQTQHLCQPPLKGPTTKCPPKVSSEGSSQDSLVQPIPAVTLAPGLPQPQLTVARTPAPTLGLLPTWDQASVE